MGLNLYRRHRRDCKSGHPEEHLSSEFDERKKGWKRCECPIFVSGTLARKYRRQSTGKWEWDDAKSVIAGLEASGSWTGEVTSKPEALPEKPAPHRKPIDQAIAAFKGEFGEHGAFATQKKYRLMLNKLKEFSEQRGYVMIDQWGPSDVREFRSSWNVSAQTAPRRMSMVRAFFEFCHANEWIDRNPARLVKNPKSRDASDRRGEQKLPFTDDEIKLMYDACPKYGNSYRHVWKGQDLADFISLSVYTGLRISDVAQFHIDRMQPETGEILVRTTKAGTHVYTWVLHIEGKYYRTPIPFGQGRGFLGLSLDLGWKGSTLVVNHESANAMQLVRSRRKAAALQFVPGNNYELSQLKSRFIKRFIQYQKTGKV